MNPDGRIPCYVCDSFRPELARFLKDRALGDRFEPHVFPADCRSLSCLPKDGDPLVISGPCDRRPQGTGCFSLIAPEWLLENLVKEGAFIVSPGWLAAWETRVASWGFDADGLKAFARETMKKICLLDTLVLEGSERRLEELSQAFGLPALRIPVGMDYCAGQLGKLIAPLPESVSAGTGGGEGSGSRPAGGAPRPSADYAMALDLLAQLNLFQTEAEVIQRILDIFSMLFAPGSLYLIRYSGGVPAGINRLAKMEEAADEETEALCAALLDETAECEGDGILALPLDFLGRRIALAVLEEFDQPGRQDSYCNLLEAIAPICALSLNNARNYEALRLDEIALRTKQKDLFRALGLRDRLFSIVGHDLRGPIGSILGLLQYLKDELDPVLDGDQRQLMGELVVSTDRILFLVANLLDWGRTEQSMVQLRPEMLDLRRQAAEVIALLKNQADSKRIELLNEVAREFILHADSNTIATVLRNLVSNALKFTPPGGKVTVRSSMEGRKRRLEVVDTGIGMDSVALSRALDLSDRQSTRGTDGERGTGLGLVLCSEYLERNGGTMTILSEPGKGTRVILEFTQP